MIEQLSFLPESREDLIERRLQQLEDKLEKNRKSLHAKHGELMRLYIEEKNRNDVLEAALCRCGLQLSISNRSLTFYSIQEKKSDIF